MAADLAIHIRTEEVTDEIMRDWCGNHLGSKYFNLGRKASKQATLEDIKRHPSWKWMEKDFGPDGRLLPGKYGTDLAYIVVADTPHVYVGEVSWLKAALFSTDDHDASQEFVPDPIAKISEIFWDEDGVEITDDVIQQVTEAYTIPNQTRYELIDSNEVIAFLKAHKGERAFTVSW